MNREHEMNMYGTFEHEHKQEQPTTANPYGWFVYCLIYFEGSFSFSPITDFVAADIQVPKGREAHYFEALQAFAQGVGEAIGQEVIRKDEVPQSAQGRSKNLSQKRSKSVAQLVGQTRRKPREKRARRQQSPTPKSAYRLVNTYQRAFRVEKLIPGLSQGSYLVKG